eukprot:GHRR01034157.1.p2 GENE.GHRR01034157.1~~GHRR01034157.1.p2  ORF type:complete len:115 (+),score=16.48 GHRR01034157.1:505-849(+)
MKTLQCKKGYPLNQPLYVCCCDLQDGIDLLVSETPDGRINLADCFILDRDEELFARPTVQEGIPVEPRMYQLLPWEHTKTGDILKRIDPKVTVSMVEDVCFNTGLCLLQFRPIW